MQWFIIMFYWNSYFQIFIPCIFGILKFICVLFVSNSLVNIFDIKESWMIYRTIIWFSCNGGCFIMQENNNVYFLYNNVALLYNNAPKQDQDRKKRTFLRKNQGYHPVLEFYSKWLDKQILLKKKCFYHSFKFISRYFVLRNSDSVTARCSWN